MRYEKESGERTARKRWRLLSIWFSKRSIVVSAYLHAARQSEATVGQLSWETRLSWKCPLEL